MPERQVNIAFTFESEKAPAVLAAAVGLAVGSHVTDPLVATRWPYTDREADGSAAAFRAPVLDSTVYLWTPAIADGIPSPAEMNASTDLTGDVRCASGFDGRSKLGTLDFYRTGNRPTLRAMLHGGSAGHVCVLPNGFDRGMPITAFSVRVRRWTVSTDELGTYDRAWFAFSGSYAYGRVRER